MPLPAAEASAPCGQLHLVPLLPPPGRQTALPPPLQVRASASRRRPPVAAASALPPAYRHAEPTAAAAAAAMPAARWRLPLPMVPPLPYAWPLRHSPLSPLPSHVAPGCPVATRIAAAMPLSTAAASCRRCRPARTADSMVVVKGCRSGSPCRRLINMPPPSPAPPPPPPAALPHRRRPYAFAVANGQPLIVTVPPNM